MTLNDVNEQEQLEAEAYAYVLEALEPDEARAFQERLAADPAARTAVAEALESLSLLAPAIEPADAPAELRDRLLAAATPLPALAPAPAPIPIDSRRSWRGRPTLWALAVAAVLLLALGGWNLQLRSDIAARDRTLADQARRIADQESELATRDRLVQSIRSADRVVALAPGSGGRASGAIVLPPGTQPAILLAGELPPLSANQVYQVWVVRGSQPTSAGVFRDPSQPVSLSAAVRPGDTVAITIEPGPVGSPGPTSQPFATAQL
ncbi:MAG: anti-sigma factor [Dehalococcoidia bacterium]